MLLDFDEHLHHRRILQHAFTNDALRSYHAVMAPHIRSNLAEWADAEQPVRMHHMFKALTLDLALETFVGVDLDPRASRSEVNKAFIAAVRAGTSIIRKPIPGTPVGTRAEGAGVPRGLLPLAPAGQAPRRRRRPVRAAVPRAERGRCTSSATTTSSTT